MTELELLIDWLDDYPDNAALFKSGGQFVAQVLAAQDTVQEAEGASITEAINNWRLSYEKARTE